jgi:hypothetical protein
MAEQWAISIVELSVPTEKVIGPFPTCQAAADYAASAHESGRDAAEKWQRVSILPMLSPGDV